MQPKIIHSEKLMLSGIIGDGAKTAELWEEFDRKSDGLCRNKNNNGYEVRFYSDNKCECFVGIATADLINAAGFEPLELPPSEYAVFDVETSKGYDSENANMTDWLLTNNCKYSQSMFNGKHFVLEVYNERFKNGIVEIWIPLFRHCQSCYMPMTKPEEFGTEKNGSVSRDYCCHCYANGDFNWKPSFEEFVEDNIPFWRDGCANDDEARSRILEVFPKLKRWESL